jgi:DNA polymerase-3 subunit epsilon
MDVAAVAGPVSLLSSDPDAARERYDALAERAVAFIRDRGGRVPEDVLVRHVFGNSGNLALWRPLLRHVLSGASDLRFQVDGYWSLISPDIPIETEVPREFIAIDVETTGLRPLHQRIIEIAAIRFVDGAATDRFETFVNPDKRIPSYISQLTGITDADVARAPRFGDVASRFLEFIQLAPLAGHNVVFDLGFINAELKRLRLSALGNARIDTRSLATRLVPALRKPTLERVARTLGVEVHGLHRAGKDAMLCGESLLRLIDHAAQQGYTGDRLQTLLYCPAVRKGQGRDGSARAPLDRTLLAAIPKLPGVYLIRDSYGNVIYVGKAKNLRDRVGSYFSQPLGYTRKMDGLLESMATVDTEVTGSELEALLLEAQLIRRYQPRYNTAMRSFEHYPFIRVDLANPWPRVSISKERKDDGAAYFGPFRNKSGARKTVDLINNVLPLRTCTRSFKDARSYGRPCIQLDLGRCLGPCMAKADAGEYRELIGNVVRFLDGRDEVLYEQIWHGLEAAAEQQDFERAAKLRNDINTVTHVVSAHRMLRDATETHTLLLVLPSVDQDSREIMLIVSGRLWAQIHAGRRDSDALARHLDASWQRYLAVGFLPLDQNCLDETNILNRWLYQHAGHAAMLTFEANPSPPWTTLAQRALSLEDAEITSLTSKAGMEDAPVGEDADVHRAN